MKFAYAGRSRPTRKPRSPLTRSRPCCPTKGRIQVRPRRSSFARRAECRSRRTLRRRLQTTGRALSSWTSRSWRTTRTRLESRRTISRRGFMSATTGTIPSRVLTRTTRKPITIAGSKTVTCGSDPNHFSIYVIGKKDESGVFASESVGYADSLERLVRSAEEAPNDPGSNPDAPPVVDSGVDDGGNGGGSGSGAPSEGLGQGSGAGPEEPSSKVRDGFIRTTVALGDAGGNGTVRSSLAPTGDNALQCAVGIGSVMLAALVAAGRLARTRKRA